MAERLNRRLILEAPERLADGAGGHSVVWAERGTLWASIAPGSGREAVAVGAALSRVILRITVRAAPAGAPSRPVAGQRFREGSRRYAILSVTEADAEARHLTCLAEEEIAR